MRKNKNNIDDKSIHHNNESIYYKKRLKVVICSLLIVLLFILLIFMRHSDKNEHKSLIDKYDSYTGKGVCIAIIDSGISEENASTVDKNINFTTLDNEYDQNGHGTCMYKIIHGEMGIAKNAKVYTLKVADKDCKASNSNIVNAVNWCTDNDVQIISMSLSTSKNNTEMHNAIIRAYRKGIHIFASVANDSCFPSYPASYNEVIGVYSWRKKDSYDRLNYLYCPVNEFCVDSNNSNIIRGNSPATAFVAGLASQIVEQNFANKKAISNDELAKKIKLYLNQ